jgi:hypothetical protein
MFENATNLSRAPMLPEKVTIPEVFPWAHGVGLSGKQPSAVTVGARITHWFRPLVQCIGSTCSPARGPECAVCAMSAVCAMYLGR